MPEVILLKDVENIGHKGQVVDVSKGYLRNFLIPRKLAAPATKGLLAEARRNGSQLPVTALVDQFYADVQRMGGQRWDTSSLIKRFD